MISFIIINYNSFNFLPVLLSSIEKKIKDIDYEIIVVNNDKKKIFLENDREKYKKVKILEINKNIGFGAGCNKGAKVAQGEILVFLNPDTEIISNKIKNVLNFFQKNDQVGALGCQLINSENNIQAWSAGVETNLLDIFKNNLGFPSSKKIWESKKALEVDWVSGAVLFIRKNIFFQINGFDEKFFLYFEDLDLCKRVRKLKYKIIYYPFFQVRHWGGSSFSSKTKQKKEFYKSQDYYFQKHLKRQLFWLRILRKIFQ